MSTTEQEMQVQKKTKKKKEEEKLAFQLGEVFTPGTNKEKDFELDQESAIYRARKGQGGDRRRLV